MKKGKDRGPVVALCGQTRMKEVCERCVAGKISYLPEKRTDWEDGR